MRRDHGGLVGHACWEFVFDLINASPCHTRFFLSASLICIFLKCSPLTIWHDEISCSHTIPWKQEKLHGNLLYPSWIPSFNSHFLPLFTFISKARSQLVGRASFPTKLKSSLKVSACLADFISCHFSGFQRNKTYSYLRASAHSVPSTCGSLSPPHPK